jgi:hypothetical protein
LGRKVDVARLRGRAPAGLPDGDVDLCLADPEDEMSDEELARVNDALARGFESEAGSRRLRRGGHQVDRDSLGSDRQVSRWGRDSLEPLPASEGLAAASRAYAARLRAVPQFKTKVV